MRPNFHFILLNLENIGVMLIIPTCWKRCSNNAGNDKDLCSSFLGPGPKKSNHISNPLALMRGELNFEIYQVLRSSFSK